MKKKFWLYWDPVSHTIQSVSPVEQTDLSFPSMMVDREVALPFLTGEQLMTEWWVGGTKEKPLLTQERADIPYHNPGAIVQIPRGRKDQNFSGIAATIFLASDTLEFTIPKRLIKTKLKSIKAKELTFMLTKRNDPEHLLKEITIPLKKLWDTGSVKVPLDLPIKYSDYSLLTHGVFNEYRFEVIRSIWQKQVETDGIKANNLVAFSVVDDVKSFEKGVVINHNTIRNTLEISIRNGANLTSYAGADGILFLTKPRDATIILHHVTIDLATLSNEQTMEVPLPDNIGVKWAMGGTPIAEKVFFTRT